MTFIHVHESYVKKQKNTQKYIHLSEFRKKKNY